MVWRVRLEGKRKKGDKFIEYKRYEKYGWLSYI